MSRLSAYWKQRERVPDDQLLDMAQRWSKHTDDEYEGVEPDYDVEREIVHEDFPGLMSHMLTLTDDLAAAQAEIERLREPVPERPSCRVCGRRDGLDAVVSDEVWAALGFDPGWYVCLWCMDRRAAEVGITASATLYFAGEAISGGNETEREAMVLDQMAELRAEIGRLRAAGDALADAVEEYADGVPPIMIGDLPPVWDAKVAWRAATAPGDEQGV